MLLRDHEGAVEADLSRYYHIDYRDRWRFNKRGERKLTLRMIAVRVAHLPHDSAISHAVLGAQAGWGVAEYLLADVWQASSGSEKGHPARPDSTDSSTKEDSPERKKKVKRAKQRARARRAAFQEVEEGKG